MHISEQGTGGFGLSFTQSISLQKAIIQIRRDQVVHVVKLITQSESQRIIRQTCTRTSNGDLVLSYHFSG